MIEQKRPDRLGLVGRQVIRDDVNRPPRRLRGDDLAEEFDKRGAGVPGHGLPEDLSRLRVERGQQREGAMAVVLEAVPLGPFGRQGQHGIEAVERLNRRFLVDGKRRRVVGRIHIQSTICRVCGSLH